MTLPDRFINGFGRSLFKPHQFFRRQLEFIDLVACVGQVLQIGDAALLVFEPRMPCEKMNAICAGLRERMKNNRQGVLAEVLRSGKIRVGDAVII